MGPLGHLSGRLPEGGLAVDAPLTRDHQSRSREALVEAAGADHKRGPRHEPRVEEGDQARPGPTGGARARNVRQPLAQGALYDFGELTERPVQLPDSLLVVALLGPVDVARALGPGQGVGDVTSDHHADGTPHRIESRGGDPLELSQSGAAARQVATDT